MNDVGSLSAARQDLNRKISERIVAIRTDVGAVAKKHGMSLSEVCRIATSKPGAMFVSPDNQTWSGKGRKPSWIKKAEREGIDPMTFRVSNT